MTEHNDRLDVRSHDVVSDEIRKLLEIFPSVRSEDGRVNFEALKAALGAEVSEGRERFGMSWPGKAESIRAAQKQSVATLLPAPHESVDFDTTQNVIIEGDNLEVLKLLQKSYLGQVKMIYIDPPYNTGNDFIYPDNYSESLQTYLEYTGQVDDEGKRFSTNTETDGRFHSKWMSMMYPRLMLARNLLTEDGVIFISIDDNELPRLLLMLEDIFGERNLKTICVKTSEATGVKMAHVSSTGIIPKLKEYVLIAKRDGIHGLHLERIRKDAWDDEYRTLIVNATKDEVFRAKMIRDSESRTADELTELCNMVAKWTTISASKFFESEGLPGQSEEEFYYDNAWRIVQIATLTGNARDLAKQHLNKLGSKNVGFFPLVTPQGKCYLISGNFNVNTELPRCKVLFADDYLTVHPGDFWADIKTTGLDNEGWVPFKNGKKPLRLLQRLITSISDTQALVLDFFAGSGTTGHAVLAQNAKDGGSRRFILVQLPEPVEEGSEAAKAGFGTIADITKERVRRAAKEIAKEAGGASKLKLADGSGQQDLGFRVFKLDKSNFRVWDAAAPAGDEARLVEQLELQVEHVEKGREGLDVVFEVLLKSKLPLTSQVEKTKVSGGEVWSVESGRLLVVVDEGVDLAGVRELAKRDPKPETVVFLDRCFGGKDSLKANARKIFQDANIEFKTI